MKPTLRVIPLGGLGEIGKNMMALECGEDIVIVDCGVQFPEEGMPGVDLVIPDISYLLERADRVRAILITHGHEDHIGALPFVIPLIKAPIYAPKLAHGLIAVKLQEKRASRGASVKAIEPRVEYRISANFQVTWYRVCHSIPDAMGLAIKTPVGTVIHTGDFKIDHTPVDGHTIDISFLAQKGSEGVLLLLSDSTYAEVPGYTPSESVVGEALDRAIANAPGRVMVATFASLISRAQQVINAAERYHRKVSIVGRSMVDNVNMAAAMGYLSLPEGILVPLEETRKLLPEGVVLLTTGSQGEPTSALVRIANGKHKTVRIIEGDTVIISATPIPGNETIVSRTINNLLRQGAEVLYDRVTTVHVHGHASREELKMVLSLVRPKYFVPVHGEYRHLKAHADLARDLGVARSGIHVLEDGDVLELSEEGAEVVGAVPAAPVYIDGSSQRGNGSKILEDRQALSRDGIVAVILPKGRTTGQPKGYPKIVSRGFLEDRESTELFEELSCLLEGLLAEDGWSGGNGEPPEAKVRETVRKFLYQGTSRRPMIIPVILEV